MKVGIAEVGCLTSSRFYNQNANGSSNVKDVVCIRVNEGKIYSSLQGSADNKSCKSVSDGDTITVRVNFGTTSVTFIKNGGTELGCLKNLKLETKVSRPADRLFLGLC